MKKEFLLVTTKIALLVFYPDTERVLKNKLIKFTTKSPNECDTQTDGDMNENISLNKRVKSEQSKPDLTTIISQGIKTETCNTDGNLGQSEGNLVHCILREKGHLAQIRTMT